MNGLCYFIIFALTLFSEHCACQPTEVSSEKLLPQIKTVGVQQWYVNPEYNRNIIFQISRYNDTYNNIGIHWEVVQDLPSNILLGTKVYTTDETYQNEKLVFENLTPICGPSQNRDLLPLHLIVDDYEFGNSCFKKGIVNIDNMGHFRFEVLVPNIEELGKYYRMDYTFGTSYETHIIISYYAEWGYLNCD